MGRNDTSIVVDGDILVYRTGFAVERAIDWGDGQFSLWADLEEAKGRIDAELTYYRDLLKASRVVVVLSDAGGSFRRNLSPSYKAGRTTRKPMLYDALRAHLIEAHKAYVRPGLEGDDVAGIIMTSKVIVPGTKILVSIDKDMKSIPGLLFIPGKLQEPVEISEHDADYWHLCQTLSGDRTDGYSGCPGVGPAKAEKIIGGVYAVRDMGVAAVWRERVVPAFEAAGLGEEEALLQARLARILRASDYDFARREPKLWEPK